MSDTKPNSEQQSSTKFVPTFLNKENEFDYSNIGNNGLFLQNIYLPEEILLHILSYLNPKELLNYSLVCHNWNRLIRSEGLWFTIYERHYNRKAKRLPWYLYYCLLTANYFDTDLLVDKNQVEQWNESYPMVDPDSAPAVQDLHCSTPDNFVLVIKARQVFRFRGWCGTGRRYYKSKWLIKLGKSELFQHILNTYKPHICLTKWGSKYDLQCGFLEKDMLDFTVGDCYGTVGLGEEYFTNEWLDIVITQYPEDIQGMLLVQTYTNQNIRNANQGSVKLLFDSIEPIDCNESEDSKMFSSFEFILKKQPLEDIKDNLYLRK